MAELELGNLYDINKQLMEKEKPLDPILLNKKIKDIFTYIDIYAMLLCRERNDYTIFHYNDDIPSEKGIQEIKETLQNRGEILSIEEQPDGTYEIWIRDFNTKENFVYYLFDYSNAIVEV